MRSETLFSTVPWVAAGGFLGGCHSDSPETAPVVVLFTLDTLGMRAAVEAETCARLAAVLEPSGLDVACLEGGVAPSSWTAESHTRLLWPQHAGVALSGTDEPGCGELSALGTLARALGGTYLFAADNPVLGHRDRVACPGGAPSWHQGADFAVDTVMGAGDWALADGAVRPADAGLDRLLAQTAQGGAAVALLNAWEVGGHFPRCWFEPQTEDCEALWSLALEAGLVSPEDDKTSSWLREEFPPALLDSLEAQGERQSELRPVFWGSMLEAIEWHAEPLFLDRVERLVEGLKAQGRLTDLVLVLVGDHGENPCVEPSATADLSCAHGGLTTEWTGLVPAFVAPASMGESWVEKGFIGTLGQPWSTINLTYALMDQFDVAAPTGWPAMEPVGEATSWTCFGAGGRRPQAGVKIVGDRALRCMKGECAATTWALPGALAYDPEPLEETPTPFLDLVGPPDLFSRLCEGP
jgi:hypothetical protein